jgi:hypothetical protein
MMTHKRNLKIASYNILNTSVFSTSGEVALSVERDLKINFKCNSKNVEGFKKEATYSNVYDDVVYFIKERIKYYEAN